jgi:hypothetical protein
MILEHNFKQNNHLSAGIQSYFMRLRMMFEINTCIGKGF